MAKIDFENINARACQQSGRLLPEWLPGGKWNGREWTCSGLQGGDGRSLKVNGDTGKWSDFATGESGGDLIDLYAQIHGLQLGQAVTT